MFILMLLSSIVFGAEGEFLNDTNSEFYCYNSTEQGCIERRTVNPSGSCIGDAMGSESSVFKIPDRTFFVCVEDGCKATGSKSVAIFFAALRFGGAENYGAMSIKHFKHIMGNKIICGDEFKLPAEHTISFPEVSDSHL